MYHTFPRATLSTYVVPSPSFMTDIHNWPKKTNYEAMTWDKIHIALGAEMTT